MRIFNNRLLFSLLFSGNVWGERENKALMEGDKVVIKDPPIPPLRKTLQRETS